MCLIRSSTHAFIQQKIIVAGNEAQKQLNNGLAAKRFLLITLTCVFVCFPDDKTTSKIVVKVLGVCVLYRETVS